MCRRVARVGDYAAPPVPAVRSRRSPRAASAMWSNSSTAVSVSRQFSFVVLEAAAWTLGYGVVPARGSVRGPLVQIGDSVERLRWGPHAASEPLEQTPPPTFFAIGPPSTTSRPPTRTQPEGPGQTANAGPSWVRTGEQSPREGVDRGAVGAVARQIGGACSPSRTGWPDLPGTASSWTGLNDTGDRPYWATGNPRHA
jgi:hypothetical protein